MNRQALFKILLKYKSGKYRRIILNKIILKIYSMNKRLKIIETISFIFIVELIRMLHDIYGMKVTNLFPVNQITR